MSNIFSLLLDRFAPPQTQTPPRVKISPYQSPEQPQDFPRVNSLLNPTDETERPKIYAPPVTTEQPNVYANPIDLRQSLPMPEQPAILNERPRLVPNQNPTLVNSQGDVQDRISLQRQKIDELSDKSNPNYQPVQRQHTSLLGRLADAGREFVVGAGQQYNRTGSLESALGGGIAGALGGATLPLAEQRQRDYEIAQNKQQLDDYLKQSQIEAENMQRQAVTDNYRSLGEDRKSDNERADKALKEKNKQSWAKLYEQQDFNEWKKTNGDAKQTDEANFRAWKMSRGDKDANDREAYRKWQIDAKKADQDLKRQGFDTQIEVAQIAANASITNTNTREAGLNQRQQIANQMQEKMSWIKHQQDMLGKQVDIQAKQAMQMQIEQAKKELLDLRQQYDKTP